MLNAIIFDFDNTLYDYDHCNKSALDLLFNAISKDYNITTGIISNLYKLINSNINSLQEK